MSRAKVAATCQHTMSGWQVATTGEGEWLLQVVRVDRLSLDGDVDRDRSILVEEVGNSLELLDERWRDGVEVGQLPIGVGDLRGVEAIVVRKELIVERRVLLNSSGGLVED